jgi:hypothetical protein
MPCYIIKLEDGEKEYYLEWSTVVDAPVTFGMSKDDFLRHYAHQYGHSRTILSELDRRMERVDETGTSARGMTVDEVLVGNRAGPLEKFLTKKQIIEKFCRRVE